MLKQAAVPDSVKTAIQPPSGGCVLKQDGSLKQVVFDGQPPSGGCVLKPADKRHLPCAENPAAFGRLCVETL